MASSSAVRDPDITPGFIEIWLEDYYLRSREDTGLARQMEEYCRRSFDADAGEFTEALVASLTHWEQPWEAPRLPAIDR